MTLVSKISLALLLCAALALGAMMMLTRTQLNRDFMDFLNRQELATIEQLLPSLQEHYRQHGHWDLLRDNSPAWQEMLHATRSRSDRRTGPRNRPNRSPHDTSRRRPPRGKDYTVDGKSGRGPHIGLRIFLLDSSGDRVSGPPATTLAPQDDALVSILLDEQPIGTLGVQPMRNPQSPEAVAFLDSQKRAILLALLISLVISVIIAVFLARHLSRPVRRVTRALGAMAEGDYDTHIAVRGNDEIGRLAADVNHLSRTLKDNQHSRQRWMADIAHELRTPLTILLGEIEAIHDGVRTLDTDRLESLHDELIYINGLIDDLHQLAITDVGSLDYRFEALELDPLLRSVIAANQASFQNRHLTLDYQADAQGLRLHADEQRLRQLLHNLLANVIQHTDSPGQCRIRLGLSDDMIHLRVEDSAPGVDSADLPQLFDRSFQGAHAARKGPDQGSGLGLAIAANIVQAHRGRISASPSALGGLTIDIHFPIEDT